MNENGSKLGFATGALECGCEVLTKLCEQHERELAKDEKRLHVEVEFADKYDRWAANNHRVDLERVQRCHLGLDNEEMSFDEKSLANMLQELADNSPSHASTFAVRAIANALRGDDEHHALRLVQKKRGKWKSPAHDRTRHRQHLAWIWRLERLQEQGWGKEAAVHRIAETTGKSVATIYAGIAEERHWQQSMRELSLEIKRMKANREKQKSL